jgi:hypothetical protein
MHSERATVVAAQEQLLATRVDERWDCHLVTRPKHLCAVRWRNCPAVHSALVLMHLRCTGLFVNQGAESLKPTDAHSCFTPPMPTWQRLLNAPALQPPSNAHRWAGLRVRGSMPLRGRRPERVKKLHKASKEER